MPCADNMKELTHENYPKHINQDGKPIVGSEWEHKSLDYTNKTITAVGKDCLLVLSDDADYERRINKRYLLDNYTPYTPEPSIQDRGRAKFETDEIVAVEVKVKDKYYSVEEKGFSPCSLFGYLNRVDCIGFVYHNVKEDNIFIDFQLLKNKDLVPVAVLLKKGGEA